MPFEGKREYMDKVFYELSQPQKSIWYLEQKYPGTYMNIISGTIRYVGTIDYDALRKAVTLVIKNNEGLRIRIHEENGEPLQYASVFEEKELDYFDFSTTGLESLYAWDVKETQRPFPLYDSDLFSFTVIKIDDSNGGVLVKLHHIISDAWNMSVIGNQITAYYAALRRNLPYEDAPKPSFFEHLKNEKAYESSERFLKDREYWNGKFASFPEPTVLKPQALTTESIMSARKSFIIPQVLSDKIRDYCSRNNKSPFTLFMAALCIYIHRVTGNDDIILGTTILNRINAREKETSGMFVSVAAPVRVRMIDAKNFSEFSEMMSRENMNILRHQKYPYNYLLKDLKRNHNLPHRLYDIVLNYQNSKFESTQFGEIVKSRWHFTGQQVESLIIHVNDRDDEGRFVLNYDFLTEIYHINEIESLNRHVINILWHALDNPERAIRRLEMLSEKEKQQILVDFNRTTADYPYEKTLHEFLYEQASQTPDARAVICGGRVMTYRELNEKSNQLARCLIEKGIGRDRIVALSVYRSFEMIIAVQAILKAGGAYLPIDPNYPVDRIRYIIGDSGATLLLTQTALSLKLADPGAEALYLEDPELYRGDISNPECMSGPDDLAYVIYTSGSTGKPKGVMIRHRSIVNRINWMQKKYPIHPEDLIMQKTPFTFDVSVWELFWWTFTGSGVLMLEPGGEKDPQVIADAIDKNKVTTMHFVPSMLGAFLDYITEKDMAGKLMSLKQVFASGEALTLRQTERFNRNLYDRCGAQLYNLYGPTEAAVDVSYFDCSPRVNLKNVPIGRPIDNVRLYILDKNHKLLPVGIPGELYISGICVARGYINNPLLTAERFLSDPFFPGQIMYKTGDKARWYPKGDIEYLGRLDFQIKIRGFRIELGEIENRLSAHPKVLSSVITAKTHKDSTYLCAYYTSEKELEVSSLKSHLSSGLPDYMVPAIFMHMKNIPLSPNGKADRKALPEPCFEDTVKTQVTAPSTGTEAVLLEIWTKILEISVIGVDEDFFDLGGDSLKVISLSVAIQKRFGAEIGISDIFQLRTVRKIGRKIDETGVPGRQSILPVPEASSYDVSPSQKRLFLLRQIDGEGINYNLPAAVEIRGPLSAPALSEAFAKMIDRHESLRTSFSLIDGAPVQIINPQAAFRIPERQADEKELPLIMKEFVRPFDLGTAPLLRAELITLGAERHVLLIDMHHIISDGESVNILEREFAVLYSGGELPEIRNQYKDYSAWQNARLSAGDLKREEEYWLGKFEGEVPVLNLPTDHARPSRKSFRGSRTSISLDPETVSGIKDMAAHSHATIFMVLYTAFHVLLSRYSGQDDIVVGIPVVGRRHPDTLDLIGMFVNTLAVRSNPAWDKTFAALLDEVRSDLIGAYENQDYPVERLVEKVCPTRDLSRNPLFDTCFVLQNMDISLMKADKLEFAPGIIDTGTTKFDLTLEADVTPDGIRIGAEYSTDLFSENTIDRFLSHYRNVLHAVLADDQIAIGKIPLLSQEEKASLITGFSDTDASFPDDETIDSIFDACVTLYPERTALTMGDSSMTYRELAERSDAFAGMLLDRGVEADDIVAISLAPSFEMIVGILGILKAGAAYLPIDPDAPVERTAYLLEDSRAKAFLAAGPFPERFLPITECIRPEDIAVYSPVSPVRRGEHAPGNLAYIIYTSGSTGKPKGVMIEHRNVVRLLFNSRFPFEFSENDVWTMFHSFCFDFSVWEMYGALLRGGRLVLVPKTKTRDTRAFIDLLIREKVTVLNQTPAAFYNLVDEESSKDAGLSLRYVIFGGDALRPRLLKPFRDRYPETRLINMYGITETTVHVTVKEIGDREIQSNTGNIGVPIPTLKTFVVDKELNLVPIGVPGELCVSGAGLGRGYLNNPELTQVKFCPNPFVGKERMYRSGDLARVLESGDLEYLGRIDNQLKIRGYRIELGEIESELLKHAKIREVFVYPRADRYGEKQLYAYFTSDAGIGYEELKSFLSVSLPTYMIPAYFIRIPEIPLNRNGKIDKAMLPGFEEAIRPERKYSAPESNTEKLLYSLWSEVLETEDIGLDDDFFAIGGESLKAVKFISKLPDNGYAATLVDLYKNPTIRELAALIDSGEEEENPVLVRISSGARAGRIPVICFPYGGGTVLSYRNMSDAARPVLPGYSLYAVNLSGHDTGADPVFLTAEETAELVFDEIVRMNPPEVVLYGHCVGCAPMLALAHLLENAGIAIAGIFAGGTYPPGYVGLYGGFFDPWMFSSDKQILDYLMRIGLPKNSFDLDSLAFVIKAFRHDARSFYRYLHGLRTGPSPRLKTGICFIAGDQDRVTGGYATRYKNWRSYSEDATLHVIPGAEHYFINTHPEELVGIMSAELAEKER